MIVLIRSFDDRSIIDRVPGGHYVAESSCHAKFDKNRLTHFGWANGGSFIFRLDALALSVIATATWLAGWLGGCHTPVLYQNG